MSHDDAGEASVIVGIQPPLEAQLAALPLEELEARLHLYGETVRQPKPHEFTKGFKQRRRSELTAHLVEAYRRRPARTLVCALGWPLADSVTGPLLAALQTFDWKENLRPQVQASGYAILKPPPIRPPAPSWARTDPRRVHRP